jgi:putative oxidoreductase
MNRSPGNVLRLGLGALFFVAGGMKLLHPALFFSDLLSYRVAFPEMFLRWVAVGLPWFEVFIGLGLIVDFWPETIRPAACLLWLVFVVMLGQALMRGLDLNCGCFGSAGSGWLERPDVAFVRAGLSFAASLYVAASPPSTTANTVPSAQLHGPI